MNTEKSQQKQKEYFDNKIRLEEYRIGDKVLIQRKEIDLQDSILQRAYELLDKMPYSQNDARLNTERSQQKQKEYFNNKIRPEEFRIGDKVLIQRKEIEKSRSAKFEDKRFGPFIIQKKLNNGLINYEIMKDKYYKNIIIVIDLQSITKNRHGNQSL